MIKHILLIQSDMQAIADTMGQVAAPAAAPEQLTLWNLALKGGWITAILAALLEDLRNLLPHACLYVPVEVVERASQCHGKLTAYSRLA